MFKTEAYPPVLNQVKFPLTPANPEVTFILFFEEQQCDSPCCYNLGLIR